VVVVVLDDMNSWTGYLGNTQVKTPNLDALAARSTAFMKAYCNDPLCNPSRASAWSGLTPQQTGIYDNWTSLLAVTPTAKLLPAWMAAHGYEIAQNGKINHIYDDGGIVEPFPPSLPETNHQCSGYPQVVPAGLFDWGPIPANDEDMPDYAYTQRTIDFINGSHAKPFMACLGLLRSHLAWYVPQKYLDMYPLDQIQVPVVPADDLADIPPAGQQVALAFNAQSCITGQGLWASAVQAYMASISFVDAQVGRLMAALDAGGHADDTIVVLWSDNGFHLGEKFHWHKQALWEQSTHVPFLIRTPGQTTGAAVDSVVSMIDLYPTVLDLCGIAAPYALAGRSLKPLLAAPSTSWDYPVLMSNAVMDAQNKYATSKFDYAVRTNQYRYIRYRDGTTELYDHASDPEEFTNIASDASHAGLIAQLDALMPANAAATPLAGRAPVR
jgi:arylsulfatase A-like enzyme